MGEQRSLFDVDAGVNQYGFPLSRRSDPPTSHAAEAIEKPRLKTHQAIFMTALAKLRRGTANEIAMQATKLPLNHRVTAETIRKRAGELMRLGAIRKDGTKACSVSGRTAAVYVSNDKWSIDQ